MLYDLYFTNLWQQISTFCLTQIPVGSTLFCIVLPLLHCIHVHVSYVQIGIFCLGLMHLNLLNILNQLLYYRSGEEGKAFCLLWIVQAFNKT